MKQLPRTDTPWGLSHTHEEIAPGIALITTASHGGYHLSEERWTQLQNVFPFFSTYAGGAWFEEDQDWAMVALAFPECFSDESIRGAVLTVSISIKIARDLEQSPQFKATNRLDCWDKVGEWLATDPSGQELRERVRVFEDLHKDEWEAYGGGTHNKQWMTYLTRVGDGAKMRVLGDYPAKHFYTDEEIRALFTVYHNPRLAAPIISLPATDAFGREWNDSRNLEDCHSDADPGL